MTAPLPQDAKAKRQARLDQRPISKQKQALVAFTIYVTNIEGLTFPQAHTLARMRWQIELLSNCGNLMSESCTPVVWIRYANNARDMPN